MYFKVKLASLFGDACLFVHIRQPKGNYNSIIDYLTFLLALALLASLQQGFQEFAYLWRTKTLHRSVIVRL